jgi:hypothetical protein
MHAGWNDMCVNYFGSVEKKKEDDFVACFFCKIMTLFDMGTGFCDGSMKHMLNHLCNLLVMVGQNMSS